MVSCRSRQVVTTHKGFCLWLVMRVELSLGTVSAVVIIKSFKHFTVDDFESDGLIYYFSMTSVNDYIVNLSIACLVWSVWKSDIKSIFIRNTYFQLSKHCYCAHVFSTIFLDLFLLHFIIHPFRWWCSACLFHHLFMCCVVCMHKRAA